MRLRSTLLGSAVLVASTTLPVGRALAEAPIRETESASYALPLGLSYLALPALAGGAAALFPDADDTAGAAIGAGVVVLGLAAPVSVHLVHSQPIRALVSPLGAAGSTLVLGLAGLGIGALVADAKCGSHNDESTSSCRLPAILLPGYIGAAMGYVGWAVYDVLVDSSVEDPNRPEVAIVPAVSRNAAGVSIFASF